jgi:cathepsin B
MLFCASYAYAPPSVGDDAPVVSQAIIDAVNSNSSATWVAGKNERFAGFSLADFRRMMGARFEDMSAVPKMEKFDAATLAAVPASYDPRESRKACTGPVLDQGFCGSCWAFGATEAISDRLCMSKGDGASYVQLAPLDLTACDSGLFKMESGCQGGQLSGAWSYAKKTGLVEESCYPYLKSEGGPVPTCEPTEQPCLPESKFIKTPKCAVSDTCTKHKLSTTYSVEVSQLKAELVNKGPVESAFTVYDDFPNYKSGVYKRTSRSQLGGHAIKIIGYGTEDGQDYWLVQNSWTTTWGDGGYFKIAAGTDECGIESQLIAGTF